MSSSEHYEGPVLESVVFQRSDTAGALFADALVQALELLSNAHGYLAHQTGPCVETEGEFLLLIWWRSLADHNEGFRQSPEYARWRSLLDPHVRLGATAKHYSMAGPPR